jgi:hypothetical protein
MVSWEQRADDDSAVTTQLQRMQARHAGGVTGVASLGLLAQLATFLKVNSVM